MWSYSRRATIASTVLADLAAIAVVAGVLYVLAGRIDALAASFWMLIPVAGMLGGAFMVSGLYNTIGMHPAQELRSVAVATTVVYIGYAFALLLAGADTNGLVETLLIACVLTLLVIVTSRALARVFFGRAAWWGVPAVVLASSEGGEAVIRTLERWPEIGLRPVALLQDRIDGIEPHEERERGLALEMTRLAPALATAYKIPYAIIAMPDLHQHGLIGLITRCSKFFKHVLVVPNVHEASALWTARPAGLIGYTVQRAAVSRSGRFVKRTIDLVGALVALILLAPLLLAIAVLIKLDSPGSVLYRQIRMTQSGRCFRVLKFRTMHLDAERQLQAILQRDVALRSEYETFHKLREDPRITRVGKVLRRASLDELPQLWNVLRGDLSLVGPRAYMPSELPKMQGLDRVILQNRPGITGLWQVSGRNALRFEERLSMDVHYVHNWTLWLDLYLLARTIPVVLTGEGAA